MTVNGIIIYTWAWELTWYIFEIVFEYSIKIKGFCQSITKQVVSISYHSQMIVVCIAKHNYNRIMNELKFYIGYIFDNFH